MQLILKKTIAILATMGLLAASFFLYNLNLNNSALAQSQTEGVGVSITIGTPGGGGGSGGGGGGSQPGNAIFQGKAYPQAFMTLSVNGSVSATFLADVDGTFSHTLTGLQSGIYTFGISAEDTDGRDSPTLSLSLSVPIGSEVKVSNLFFPPTISINSPTEKGQEVFMQGQAFPNSNIFLFIEPGSIVKEVKAQPNGKWQYSLPTQNLNAGNYTLRTRAITDIGEQSELSNNFSFEISPAPPDKPEPPKPPGECPEKRADYNCDGRVNYKDASILLHYWFQGSEIADLNGDGFVDHVDFSILMYYWTG